MDEVPEAAAEDVTFRLTWREVDGQLQGELEAANVSAHPVRLSGKPDLTPIGADGRPLAAHTVVSMEMRLPGHTVIRPGERAVSRVGWGGWDGPPGSGRVVVRWPGGQSEIAIDGPPQPASSGPATNLWSSWFDRV